MNPFSRRRPTPVVTEPSLTDQLDQASEVADSATKALVEALWKRREILIALHRKSHGGARALLARLMHPRSTDAGLAAGGLVGLTTVDYVGVNQRATFADQARVLAPTITTANDGDSHCPN